MNTIPVLQLNEIEEGKLQPLLEKVREYLRHGVKSCWLAIPGTETISIHPQTGPSQSISTGVVKDADLGIDVALSEVFA